MNIAATEAPIEPAESVVVTETPVGAPPEAESSEADLSAIWKKANDETSSDDLDQKAAENPVVEELAKVKDAEKAPDKPQEAATEAKEEKTPEDTPEARDAPSELSKPIREAWDKIPPEAQEAIKSSQQDLNRRLSDQGRLIQAIDPIKSELVAITQEMPEFAALTPDKVLGEIRKFRSEVLEPLGRDPVNTILRVAQERGVIPQLQAAFSGQQPTQDMAAFQTLVEQNKALNQRLEQVDTRLNSVEVSPIEQSVADFAAKSEHWKEVEQNIPNAIRYVQEATPGISPTDALRQAYEMEVQRIGKAVQETPAPEAEVVADPQHTEKVLAAKSVNVSGEPTNPAPLTETQMMSKIWRKSKS